jgi:pimeloyl-ACP methyl ester carboxylesterase
MRHRWCRRRRRSFSFFWLLLGLVGIGAIAAAFASRAGRRRPWAEDEEPGSSPQPREPPAALVTGDSEAVWVAGPAGNLYVRDGGGERSGGLPVVFLHSLAGNGGQWALQRDHLRHSPRNRRTVAIDFRGHGESDPAEDGDYSVPGLAGDVAAVADQLGLRRFVLAGHSLGGAVAIEYAGRHPERVAGLLLVDPNGDQTRVPAEQMNPFLAALRRDPLRELEGYFRQLVVGGDPDAARWVLADLRLTHEDAIAAAVEGATRYPPLPALARYGGSRLSIVSAMNSLPFSLHNLLPELPVRLLPGTGHWLMMDRPEAFNRLLDEFLEEVEATA